MPDVVLSPVDDLLLPHETTPNGSECKCNVDTLEGDEQDLQNFVESTDIIGNNIAHNITAEDILNITLGQTDENEGVDLMTLTEMWNSTNESGQGDRVNFQ